MRKSINTPELTFPVNVPNFNDPPAVIAEIMPIDLRFPVFSSTGVWPIGAQVVPL
ncbi:hypothetical protein GCM10009765_81810 [Fodinicola feengrottensis]|uniref:Uncharacterized protein n=1 Tax=Fodinicola feengrottensis TaxID=435914 RepID=A0ABN2JAK2_9ACTN|nr:hypothetical protein [Fodinicola feengrottensis]